MSRGEEGASLTPWDRQRAALCAATGTTDIGEAIKREAADVDCLSKHEILNERIATERSKIMSMKECEFEGCDRSFYDQGDGKKRYCAKHETKEKRAADPPAEATPEPDPAPAKKAVAKKAAKKPAKKAHHKTPLPKVEDPEIFPMTSGQISDLCRAVNGMTQSAMIGYVLGYLDGRRAV